MLNISRWSSEKGSSYSSVRRFYESSIDWMAISLELFKHYYHCSERVYLLCGDETVEGKAGKKTPGKGWFYNSIYGVPIPGVCFFNLSVLDVSRGTSWVVGHEQLEKDPKGHKKKSKKKKKSASAKNTEQKQQPSVPKKRGRKKGSKNKPYQVGYLFTVLSALLGRFKTHLASVGCTMPICYFVGDGHYGNRSGCKVCLDNDLNLILSAMPSQIAPQTRSRRGWFGGRRFQQSSLALMDKPYIAAGTPLIGLSSHGATSKAFWPLWLQCWWQGLPRGSNRSAPTSSGASQATVQQEEGNSTVVNDTTKSPERGSTTNFTKAQTASTPKDQQAKQEPSVKKKLMLNVKPDKKMTKSKMGMAKAGNNTGPLRAIGQRILLPVTTLLASRSSNATTIPSSSYSQSGAHYWYPTLSSIGVVVVLVLYYLQYQSKLEKSWIPEIARIKELALKYIQTATNGGWHLMHLRDAVLQAEQDVHGTERRHLERDIWPRVLRQLQADDRIARSDVPSPTGKRQTIISWVGEKNVEKSANEGLPSMDQHVTFEDTA